MPLSYPAGTLAEHRACRRRGGVRREPPGHGAHHRPGGTRPAAGSPHQRPQQGGTRAGRSTPTCSTRPTRRWSTTSSCGGSTTSVFDVMPNASNTSGVSNALGAGAVDVTETRAVIALQGPAPPTPGHHLARGGRHRPLPRGPHDLERRRLRGRRHRLHRRGRPRGGRPRRARAPRSGTPCSPRGSSPPGSAPATPCGSRPVCRCTATSWAPGSPRCRPGSGWVVTWDKGDFEAGPRWPPSASAASPVVSGP